jgi:hypothetical protein
MSKNSESTTIQRITISLPVEVVNKAKEEAESQNRTLSNYISTAILLHNRNQIVSRSKAK